MEQDLSQIMMSNGKQTAQEWLMTQPESWREIETEAILLCLQRNWELNLLNVMGTVRELDAQRNPKGW